MARKTILILGLALSACSAVGGGTENYQAILAKLCNAPPSIMANVLTTPELQRAWSFICGHVPAVPATPVMATIAEQR